MPLYKSKPVYLEAFRVPADHEQWAGDWIVTNEDGTTDVIENIEFVNTYLPADRAVGREIWRRAAKEAGLEPAASQ